MLHTDFLVNSSGTVTYHDPKTNEEITVEGEWDGIRMLNRHPHFAIKRPDGTHLYVPMDGQKDDGDDSVDYPSDYASWGGVA